MSRTVSEEQNLQSGLIASVLLLLVCLIATWPNINSIRGALFISPSSYNPTAGTITQSYISWHGGKGSGYNFNISYAYSVEGKNYIGKQVTFGARGSSDKSFAEAYTRKYPVGHRVTVYYKMDEPSFAVLEPTVVDQTKGIFIGVVIWSALCIFGIFWLAWKLRQLKQA